MTSFSARAACKAAVFAVFILSSTISLADLARPVIAERIDLIRHGESEDNPDKGKPVARLDGTLSASRGKILSGWNSASLTMLGVSQAVRAGEALQQQEKSAATKLHDALWLYSPLLRTRQTLTAVLVGARLADNASLKIRPDTRLFERSAGDVTNLTWDEAAQLWPEMKKGRDALVFKRADASYPNGESLEMVYRRASAAIDEAIASERRVIVVSHELTIKALVAHLVTGSIDDKAFAFAVENAKPITLVRRDGKWEIASPAP
jgi:broad specificity phosphatase PhoE